MRAAVALGVTLMLLGGAARAQDAPMPWTELHRVPIPDELPPHPRVFCTQADIDRIRADYEAGDEYTRVAVDEIVRAAEGIASDAAPLPQTPAPQDFGRIATLAQAYALTGEESYGRRALERLLHAAEVCPTLEPTRSRGLFSEDTLREGPVAINAAMAWDLIAGAPFVTAEQRARIEDDLLRRIGWVSGHGCRHPNSSNWRSWALAILAACGFATGDRELIDEAINGVWDPERNLYLYGYAQQIGHSIFADGIHWERSVGYNYYTMSALQWVLLAAENSGIDLWHAEIPGILGPFEGGANHEEFGPPGPRSIRYLLDGQFYHTFPDLSIARINNSGTRRLSYHQIYELAWDRYRDPKYAWLIRRERDTRADGPPWWSLWQPSGESEASMTDDARIANAAWRLTTGERGRIALVQDVVVPADAPTTVSGWVKALEMDGGAAHIRCNIADDAFFTDRVTEAGDWRQVSATIGPVEGAGAGETRRIRLHLFLEGGAGDVIWDEIEVRSGDGEQNYAQNANFATIAQDGRRTDFFHLVHARPDVPEGDFSLADGARIGLVGENRGGCTNFPIGGFTVLRSDALDESSPAVKITWGPYGSGHDHPDALGIVVYGRGAIVAPDAGAWPYDHPMQLTWANQTIAHNTLTVNEVSQYPQEDSDSIWASERGDRRVFGVQRLFHPGEQMKVARFTSDTAYEGVLMDRTLVLVGGYLIDVFQASSDEEQLYDLALHGRGEFSSDTALASAPEGWLTARGYAHIEQVRRVDAPELLRATFAGAGPALSVLHSAPIGAQIITGVNPVRSGEPPTSAFISRVRADSAAWVSVLEPFDDAPAVTDLTVQRLEDGLRIVVTHAGGVDELHMPSDPGGPVELRRIDAAGAMAATETAASAEQ